MKSCHPDTEVVEAHSSVAVQLVFPTLTMWIFQGFSDCVFVMKTVPGFLKAHSEVH